MGDALPVWHATNRVASGKEWTDVAPNRGRPALLPDAAGPHTPWWRWPP
jgi:hypothetical protein